MQVTKRKFITLQDTDTFLQPTGQQHLSPENLTNFSSYFVPKDGATSFFLTVCRWN